MSLSIDDKPVVTPTMAYVEKGGKLNVKEQQIYKITNYRISQYIIIM